MFRNKSCSSSEKRQKEFGLAQSNEKEEAEIQINFPSRKSSWTYLFLFFWLTFFWLFSAFPSPIWWKYSENTRKRLITSCVLLEPFFVGLYVERPVFQLQHHVVSDAIHTHPPTHQLQSIKKLISQFLALQSILDWFSTVLAAIVWSSLLSFQLFLHYSPFFLQQTFRKCSQQGADWLKYDFHSLLTFEIMRKISSRKASWAESGK